MTTREAVTALLRVVGWRLVAFLTLVAQDPDPEYSDLDRRDGLGGGRRG